MVISYLFPYKPSRYFKFHCKQYVVYIRAKQYILQTLNMCYKNRILAVMSMVDLDPNDVMTLKHDG